MSKPLISVIIPVYKTEKYLERCVDSVRNQTYRNLEIILVDDGSPDRCGEMCDAFAQQDIRIRVIHKKNGGLSEARNVGLDAMHGEYVGFVDSDDWIAPEMYSVLYERIQAHDAQISICGLSMCSELGVRKYLNPETDQVMQLSTNEAMKMLCRNRLFSDSMCNKLYSARIFDNLRMKPGILYEDLQVQHHCFSKAANLSYTAVPMYFYFMSTESISRPKQFSVKQYDYILASRERIAFVREAFQDSIPFAQARHIELILLVLYQARNHADWNVLRNGLVAEALGIHSKEVLELLDRNTKLKLRSLRIGLSFYIALMRIHALAKRFRRSRAGAVDHIRT